MPVSDQNKWYGNYRAKVVQVDIDDNNFGAIRVYIPDMMLTNNESRTTRLSASDEKSSKRQVFSEKIDPWEVNDSFYGSELDAVSQFIRPNNMMDLDKHVPNKGIDDTIDEESGGLIAYPANNPLGGRNDQYDSDEDLGENHFQGTVYVPTLGSWVWVFFEAGNPNRPFYMNGLDIQNTKLPPENRVGPDGKVLEDPHKGYTVIKTHSGRTIHVNDSEDVARVEITGKKRTITSGTELDDKASGDVDSTYTIEGNQTVILLDEREGKEKILLQSYKGDYIHFDIDERKLQISFAGDINIKTEGSMNIDVAKNLNISVGQKYSIEANDAHMKSKTNNRLTSELFTHIRAGGKVKINGSATRIQSSSPASKANPSSTIEPRGGRNV